MKLIPLQLLLILAFLLAGCGRSSEQTPFVPPPPADTPIPTATPEPTATPIPLPTPVPEARVHAGDQALSYGDYERALAEYQAALNDNPGGELGAAALLGLGRTRLLERNYYEAERLLMQTTQEYPATTQAAAAFFLLGRTYDALEQYPQAAQAYQNYLALRPGLIDGYVHDLRGTALFAGGDYAGAAEAFRLALQSPSTLDRIYVQLKLARAVGLAGDPAAALPLYDDAFQRAADDYVRALIVLRKAQIYASLGQTGQAFASYQEVVTYYPRAYEAYSALLALDQAGIEVDDLQRGLVTYFAGEYGQAMAAFDKYLQKAAQPAATQPPVTPAIGTPVPLPPSYDTGSALYYYGMATSQQGGYQQAIQFWERIIANLPGDRFWDDAYEQKSYTQWAYLDDYKGAVKTLLEFVDKAPGHPRAAEFLLDAALVAERDNELAQAAELFERVINLYPEYEKANRALFLAGITRLRSQENEAALGTFLRYQGQAVTLEERAAASFWIGKTYAASGDHAAAAATWQATANIDPTGYYSERASDLLQERQPFSPPLIYDLSVDWPGERRRAEDWLRDTFKLAPEVDLAGLGALASDPAIVRGTELWDLGMLDEARAEFEAVRLAAASDPALSYQLTNYLLDLGLYRSAIQAARQVLALAYLDGAATLSAPSYFNHVRFGAYYADLILPLAKQYDFHPLFLFAVVRQESLFEGFVSSSAAARGLMQIIPPTGDDLAKRLGWPPNYQADDLYRPLVNLTFGVEYLARQRQGFNGNLFAALAGYNGGPGNAARWLELAPDDPDVFLESIRFEETRNYLRGVYELFGIYRLIYNRTP